MSHTRQERLEAFGRIVDTLEILRVKCPWDAKQTNESLRPNSIEEVYELCQALADDHPCRDTQGTRRCATAHTVLCQDCRRKGSV